MCPSSIYLGLLGLKVVPILVLWGQSIYYLATWTLRVPLFFPIKNQEDVQEVTPQKILELEGLHKVSQQLSLCT